MFTERNLSQLGGLRRARADASDSLKIKMHNAYINTCLCVCIFEYVQKVHVYVCIYMYIYIYVLCFYCEYV